MQRHNLVTVVLATYNERENILRTIQEILNHITPPVEIIVVDDDSPDGTWKLVEDLNHPSVRLIRRQSERGLASAFYRGILESKGDVIAWMDADMSMPPRLLPEMIQKLESCDIAIASRYVPGGKDERSFLRVASSLFINGLARLILGLSVRDCDSGFVVVKRSVIQNVPIRATGYGEYFMEFLYAAKRKGFSICEIPYIFRERELGVTKSAPSITHFFKTGLDYMKRIVVARFRN